MLKLSPKATVPVLYLAAMNTVIDESIDIMHWALSQNDPDQWYLENGSARDANDELIHQNDEEFKPWLDKYKYADRHPEQTQESYRDCAERFLLKLEALLNKNDYLFGDKVSLADMAIFPFIRQFAFVDKAWFDQSDYQKLIAWLQKLLDSNLFNRVMNKYPRWQTGDADTLFPPE